MQTGEIGADLINLNKIFNLPNLPELVQHKIEGTEKGILPEPNPEFHRKEYHRLAAVSEKESERSFLPDNSGAGDALNDLLIRLRMGVTR
jgi:hypothetical protein